MPSLTVTAPFPGLIGTKLGLFCCVFTDLVSSAVLKLLRVMTSTPIARLPFLSVVPMILLVVDSKSFSDLANSLDNFWYSVVGNFVFALFVFADGDVDSGNSYVIVETGIKEWAGLSQGKATLKTSFFELFVLCHYVMRVESCVIVSPRLFYCWKLQESEKNLGN